MRCALIDQSIRFLHVVASLNHGGTEVTCRDLIGEFSKRPNVTNFVATLITGSGPIQPALEVASGHPVTVLGTGFLQRFWEFYKLCLKLRPSAVMFHFFRIDHVILAGAARLAGVRSVISKAGNPAPNVRGRNTRNWQLIIQLSKAIRCRIVSSSAYIEASLLQLSNLPSGSCVVHNGCDCDKICERAQNARMSKAPVFTVGMISRLDPIKDHAALLTAFAMVVRLNPQTPVRLRIIGDGVLRETLKAQAIALGIADTVEFLGNRIDVAEQLGQFDLFVFSTTREEGFGIVLIEALAAGVPVVASDVPACREVLRNGEFGKLLPPSDPQSLALAIYEHLAQAKINAQIPVPHPAAIKEAYGLQTMAQKYWTLLALEKGE